METQIYYLMKNWFIVQSHSNFENKVSGLIKEEAEKAKISDKFEEIIVPTHDVTEMLREVEAQVTELGLDALSARFPSLERQTSTGAMSATSSRRYEELEDEGAVELATASEQGP